MPSLEMPVTQPKNKLNTQKRNLSTYEVVNHEADHNNGAR